MVCECSIIGLKIQKTNAPTRHKKADVLSSLVAWL